MLSILGKANPGRGFCDRLSRRGFLQIGGATWAVWLLTKSSRIEAKAGVGSSHKAIINVYLPGGPPHIGHVGPEAGRRRGDPRRDIGRTGRRNVPGMEICELFPKLAAMADKFAIIRSLADSGRRPRGISVHDRP